MEYQLPPDLDQLVSNYLASGLYGSTEDVLREALAALARQRDEVAAITEGIEDMEAGRYRPLDEVDLEIRAAHGFPPDA